MKVLVIGNNVGGTTVAKTVRDLSPDVDIELYTDEGVPYYPRPRLIDYLSGAVQEKDVPFYPTDWYEKNRLKLHLNSRAEKLEPAGKRIRIDGSWHEYDRLVLATGSSPFVPPFKGLPKRNIFTLRTIVDARNIRETAARSRHAIVIGGGLLGLESARALCSGFPHLKVTVLEYAEHILSKQLDHQGAAILQRWIESTGLRILTRAETDEVIGDEAVSGVRLKDGRTIEGDLVIISAGTRSNSSLAKEAGLKVNKGVVVDETLRTSDPDIFAVGDVAEFNGQVWAMIPPALDQARVAAHQILGRDGPVYRGTVPSNTLKVVGIDLTSIGVVRSEHEPPELGYEEISAVSSDGKVYKKFVLRDDTMIGAILLGTKKEANKVIKLIKDGQPVTALKERLRDPAYDFS